MLVFRQKKVYMIFSWECGNKNGKWEIIGGCWERAFLSFTCKRDEDHVGTFKSWCKIWHTQYILRNIKQNMFTRSVSWFHHASGPSHCCPSNLSQPTPFQVYVHTYTYSFPAKIQTLTRYNTQAHVLPT